MFEVGWSEYLVIFALALIVLGPEKLPKLAASVGRWVGRARTMARQFRDQLEAESETIRTAVHDVQKDFESAATGMENSVSEVKRDVETGLSEPRPESAADSAVSPPELVAAKSEMEAASETLSGSGADLEITAELPARQHDTADSTGELRVTKELDERG